MIADPINRLEWGYAAAPEPTAALLMGLGALGLAAAHKRFARASGR